jgi:hypothetical protein
VKTPGDRWREVQPALEAIEERYRRERLRIGPRAEPQGDAAEKLRDLFETAVEAYVDADDELREEMRDFVGAAYCLPRSLLPLVGRYIKRMNAANALTCLTLAAAALSLENLRRDWRDSFDLLLALYAKASELGVDAQPTFTAVAAISSESKTSRLAPYSMREFLGGFDRSHQFKVDGLRRLKSKRPDGGVA